MIITRAPVTSAEFQQLADGCTRLQSLEIDSALVTDDDLAVLAQTPQLQKLKLGAPIADEGLAHIAQAGNLIVLNLPAAEFTDVGLEHVASLPRLQLLRFHSPHVTDAGLAHFATMPSLRFLHLIDVPVTDAGLVHLQPMTRLESFYIDGGLCTDEGLGSLLRALPNLHLHRDQLHIPGDPQAHPHE